MHWSLQTTCLSQYFVRVTTYMGTSETSHWPSSTTGATTNQRMDKRGAGEAPQKRALRVSWRRERNAPGLPADPEGRRLRMTMSCHSRTTRAWQLAAATQEPHGWATRSRCCINQKKTRGIYDGRRNVFGSFLFGVRPRSLSKKTGSREPAWQCAGH